LNENRGTSAGNDLDGMSPLHVRSLKEEFISRFEDLILSGRFPVGVRLPSERELARQLGVSRPVVHEGLLELAGKGLVAMIPRRGSVVNDYRKTGSLELLISLFPYSKQTLDPALLSSILRMRVLFETDITVLAAAERSDDDAVALEAILTEEREAERLSAEEIARIDYRFHHLLALASGNVVYPLLMNSLKPLYIGLLETFYRDRSVLPEVLRYHKEIVAAIRRRDAQGAGALMAGMLAYSERELKRIISVGAERRDR